MELLPSDQDAEMLDHPPGFHDIAFINSVMEQGVEVTGPSISHWEKQSLDLIPALEGYWQLDWHFINNINWRYRD